MTSVGSSFRPGVSDALFRTPIAIPSSCVLPIFFPLSPNSFVLRYKTSHGRGYGGGIRTTAASSGAQMEWSIKKNTSENTLVIYSKTRCRYCREVKALFERLGVKPSVVELDELGPTQRQLQNALCRLTGQSTVPNIFIGGKHIGGCSDTMALHKKGELVPLLSAAGVKIS